MRMLIIARFDRDRFNAAVRDGSSGRKMQAILEAMKPEQAYFTEMQGRRTGVFVVDLPEASGIPAIAEPLFLTFNADVEFHPAMTPEDLQAGGLEALGDRWG